MSMSESIMEPFSGGEGSLQLSAPLNIAACQHPPLDVTLFVCNFLLLVPSYLPIVLRRQGVDGRRV